MGGGDKRGHSEDEDQDLHCASKLSSVSFTSNMRNKKLERDPKHYSHSPFTASLFPSMTPPLSLFLLHAPFSTFYTCYFFSLPPSFPLATFLFTLSSPFAPFFSYLLSSCNSSSSSSRSLSVSVAACCLMQKEIRSECLNVRSLIFQAARCYGAMTTLRPEEV